MSGSLPFLPGYRIEVKPRARYHKPHMFDLKNGIRVDLAKDPLPSATAAAGLSILGQDPLSLTTTSMDYGNETKALEAESQTALSSAPQWVAFDRKVLRFNCYFKEAVYSSPIENFRVRKCVLYYYLEDNSMHIAEPKIENSGMNQGVLVRRHRIAKPDGSLFSWEDLNIGVDILVYGRVYRLTDCDAFTRAFLEANGRTVPAPEDIPLDPFTKKHTVREKAHNKLMNPHKQYMEASLGKSFAGMDVEATQKFLRNDGKVLRFYATWSDPKLFGEKQAYIIHYFLADDTVEVLEVQQPNSGRDPFPALLKRCKLPKNYKETVADISSIGVRNTSALYYTEADFKVGQYVMVYGRKLFICGADKFTQEFYIKNYGMTEADFPRLNMDDDVEVVPRMLPPPHTGFGSEEDSLNSFLFLNPKVPKQNFKKLMEFDGLMMRFLARFKNPQPEDRERQFIITFFLANDTLSVFEKFTRNSGFIGGKFLERTRIKNEVTGEYFKPTDFYVGAVLRINKFEFELIDADESTQKWMEQNEHIFGEVLAKQNEVLAARKLATQSAHQF